MRGKREPYLEICLVDACERASDDGGTSYRIYYQQLFSVKRCAMSIP